jgi:hypothetical protein
MMTLVLNIMGVMKIMSCTMEHKGMRAILTDTMGLEVTKTALSAHILKAIMAIKTDMPMKCRPDYYCLEDYECILLNGERLREGNKTQWKFLFWV